MMANYWWLSWQPWQPRYLNLPLISYSPNDCISAKRICLNQSKTQHTAVIPQLLHTLLGFRMSLYIDLEDGDQNRVTELVRYPSCSCVSMTFGKVL